MQCPYCGGEMTDGFVQAARTVYFTEEPHEFLLTPFRGDVRLSKENFFRPTVRARHCPACRIVIVDYASPAEP